tara:strand:+ start:333 stop:1634 length:1302 start_codon:yes stop_codon:yes gene_type:complete
MNNDLVINIKNLSKCYRIGSKEKNHDTIFGKMSSFLKGPFNNYSRIKRLTSFSNSNFDSDIVWALNNINLKIYKGDVVGIIGRNGAGKSTLLKILAQITYPETGRVTIRGRIASLLEVGTGFHPDLTGRENIYLNGTILGMTRSEIKNKLKEIISFSGVKEFIDTPVKRYSSGMGIRLAFSVAAHLDPEILLIDEVLAVGDAEFQNKCLGKMKNAAKSGKTVLFVSHNLASIKQLCTKIIWVDNGMVREIGSSSKVISNYLNSFLNESKKNRVSFDLDHSKQIQIIKADIIDKNGFNKNSFECDESVYVKITLDVRSEIPGLYGYFSVTRIDGIKALVSVSDDEKPDVLDSLKVGEQILLIEIPSRSLGYGKYFLSFSIISNQSINSSMIDSPGKIGEFILSDNSTSRGNSREGFFSTILKWRHLTDGDSIDA